MVERINRVRHIVAPVIAVTGLIALRESTGFSSWVLLIPVLLATFLIISVWDRLTVRGDD